MATPPAVEPQGEAGIRRRIPVTTWIGIAGTALIALIALASSGVWTMLATIALVILFTAVYGLFFRRRTWLRLPPQRRTAALGLVAAAVILFGAAAAANGTTHPASPTHSRPAGVVAVTASPTPPRPASTPTTTPTPTPTPVITTKLVTTVTSIPFPSRITESATRPKGTSTITTRGVDGTETRTYVVTYTNGIQTGRTLRHDAVTTRPVTQVTTVGTHVAPAPPATTCRNGTYVNTAGNTVCRPETSSTVPHGATAKCRDGSYSFSQSRRGTCSYHGGVAEWL